METIRQLWNVGQSVYNISGLISSLKKQGETVLDTERPKGYNKPVQCHLLFVSWLKTSKKTSTKARTIGNISIQAGYERY